MTTDIPEWAVTLDAAGKVTFRQPGQARAYLRRLRETDGDECVAQFYAYRAKRSSRQNRAGYALIKAWARERGWEPETLKQFVLGRVFGWLEFVDPQYGEVVKVLAEPHTSTLTVGQFAEFIERTLELAAEDGVWLEAPDEYRRATARGKRLRR